MVGAETGRELIQREALSAQVARLLIRDITDRKLRPGDEVPGETQIASRYRVSRSVAREALRQLAALDMIQLASGKHPVIKPLSGELLGVYFHWALQIERSTFLELLELRRAVEGACAYHAALRRQESDIGEFRMLLDAMAGEDDRQAFAELDMQLHRAIARAAHNRLLHHTVESIRLALRDVILTGIDLMDRTPHKEPTTVRLRRTHELMVAPIVDRDPDLARRRMDDHLRGAEVNYIAASQSHARS